MMARRGDCGITGEGTLSDHGLDSLAKGRAGSHLGNLGSSDARSHCERCVLMKWMEGRELLMKGGCLMRDERSGGSFLGTTRRGSRGKSWEAGAEFSRAASPAGRVAFFALVCTVDSQSRSFSDARRACPSPRVHAQAWVLVRFISYTTCQTC